MGILIDITKCNHCAKESSGHHGYCPECGSEDVLQTQAEFSFEEVSKEAGLDVSILPRESIDIEVWKCTSCDSEIFCEVVKCPYCSSRDVHYWYSQKFEVTDD